MRNARTPLRIILIATLLIAGCATGPEHASCSLFDKKIYFPDGFDQGDGMGAYLDVKNNYMAVADQVFPLTKCKNDLSKVCFISEYFTFASRHYKDIASWVENGYHFAIVGRGTCPASICKNAPHDTYIITSHQEYKDIDFYYSDRCGLMGWKMYYSEDDGSENVEKYNVPAYIRDSR